MSNLEYPRYSATVRTNSAGEVLVDVTVNGDDIEIVKKETPELYSHIVEDLSAYGCKIVDSNEQDIEIDTTAKEVAVVKVGGRGLEVIQTYKDTREALLLSRKEREEGNV